MDALFCEVKQMADRLTRPFGDCAPRLRHLVADYKDTAGRDYHRELMTLHDPRGTDADLVESVREEVARMGFALSALGEYMPDGSGRALYLSPGYLEEYRAVEQHRDG